MSDVGHCTDCFAAPRRDRDIADRAQFRDIRIRDDRRECLTEYSRLHLATRHSARPVEIGTKCEGRTHREIPVARSQRRENSRALTSDFSDSDVASLGSGIEVAISTRRPKPDRLTSDV